MPREALFFICIIVAVVGIAIAKAVSSSGEKEFDDEPYGKGYAEDDEDDYAYEIKPRAVAENTARTGNKDLDIEIARKTAELERLNYEIEQVKKQPHHQPKPRKKHGCLGCFTTIAVGLVIAALIACIQSVDTTPTVTHTTNTSRPKATATAKYIEPSKIKKAIEDTLANLKLFDYCNVSCDETAVSIYVGINNIAEELSALKAIGENENNKDWVTIKDNLMKIYNQIVGTMSQYGYTKEKCAFYLVNTKNPDNFLLMIHGGAITYDCMK